MLLIGKVGMSSGRRARILRTLGKERFDSPACLPKGGCNRPKFHISSSGSVDLEMVRGRKIVRKGQPSNDSKTGR